MSLRERSSSSSPEPPDTGGDPPHPRGGGVPDTDLERLRERDPDVLRDLELLRDSEGDPRKREDPDDVLEPKQDLDVLDEGVSCPTS